MNNLPPVKPPPPIQDYVQKSEWQKFISGFVYASSGIWYALRTQRNVRVHTAIAVMAIAASILLHITPVEFALIFVAVTGVFIAEMFNTVLELCVDLASPQYHPLAKIAKDVSAGAVLLNAILAVIIGLFIFLPHILTLLSHH